MRLAIFENEVFEDEQALVDVANGVVILSGDEYHDKISYLIDGYLAALHDHGIYDREAVQEESISPDHPWYDKCDFHD